MRALYVLTCKCAPRRSCVTFLDIVTSKIALNPWVFQHVDLQMRFAPQRRDIFGHWNFEKCSRPGVVWAFSLANVLRATVFGHWNFKNCSNSEVFWAFSLAKALRATAACHFSFLCWTATSAPAALASLYFSNIRNHESLKNHSDSWLP